MKRLNNVPLEKVLVIQGQAMRVNLPFGMQSSDYSEPEMVTKVAKEPVAKETISYDGEILFAMVFPAY
jgi:hypothetical protein